MLVTEPGQQPRGYAGTFASPDGHIWMVTPDLRRRRADRTHVVCRAALPCDTLPSPRSIPGRAVRRIATNAGVSVDGSRHPPQTTSRRTARRALGSCFALAERKYGRRATTGSTRDGDGDGDGNQPSVADQLGPTCRLVPRSLTAAHGGWASVLGAAELRADLVAVGVTECSSCPAWLAVSCGVSECWLGRAQRRTVDRFWQRLADGLGRVAACVAGAQRDDRAGDHEDAAGHQRAVEA